MEILDSAIPLSRLVLAPKDEFVEKSSPLRGAAEQIYEDSRSWSKLYSTTTLIVVAAKRD